MEFDDVNLTFFHICPFIVANFNEKYELSVDILKVHFFGKKLALRVMKSDKNCVSYYLKILTIEL